MVAFLCALVALAGPKAGLDVRVDPRVELLMIVFRLAGAEEYNQPAASSPYSKRVDTYFGKFKEHATIKKAQAIRESFGIGFDAVPVLAVHLSDVTSFKERVPFNTPPRRWDARWKPEVARDFVKGLKSFAKDTNFAQFLRQEKGFYAKAEGSMRSLTTKHPVDQWVTEFYGSKPSMPPFVIVGLLCGGGNYGMSVEFPNGKLEMCPVIGASSFDKDGIPVFSEGNIPTIIHEFSHAYVNPMMVPYMKRISPLARAFFPKLGGWYRNGAYGDPNTIVNESFVRVVETYLTKKHLGADLGFRSLVWQRCVGFLWTGELVDRVPEYEANRAKYPKFAEFMPLLVEDFARMNQNPEMQYAHCPNVEKFEAIKGAVEGVWQVVSLKVTYDQPMLTDRRGLTMSPDEWEVVKRGAFSADAKTYEVTFKLKKGKTYKATLNSMGYGVASEAGYPLLPYSETIEVL